VAAFSTGVRPSLPTTRNLLSGVKANDRIGLSWANLASSRTGPSCQSFTVPSSLPEASRPALGQKVRGKIVPRCTPTVLVAPLPISHSLMVRSRPPRIRALPSAKKAADSTLEFSESNVAFSSPEGTFHILTPPAEHVASSLLSGEKVTPRL